jgi:hypothetical protein
VSLFHEPVRPPSWESSSTNWSKEAFSFSVHEVARDADERMITSAVPNNGAGVANRLVLLLHEEWGSSGFMILSFS